MASAPVPVVIARVVTMSVSASNSSPGMVRAISSSTAPQVEDLTHQRAP
ncbi:hypothetical protein [Nocardia sp. NPDC019255]